MSEATIDENFSCISLLTLLLYIYIYIYNAYIQLHKIKIEDFSVPKRPQTLEM